MRHGGGKIAPRPFHAAIDRNAPAVSRHLKEGIEVFTRHQGAVTAATEWDGPAHRRHVRLALTGNYDRLFHDAGVPRFSFPLRTDLKLASALMTPRLERAIGVIYLPETERRSQYFHARLAKRFDYLLPFDETRAVEPLERTSAWEAGELAETYPSGR